MKHAGGTANWLEQFAVYMSETSTAPYEHIRLAGLTTISALLERKSWITYWMRPLYPNIFSLLIGPPASGKTLAIVGALDILRRIPDLYLTPNDCTLQQFYAEIGGAQKHFQHENTKLFPNPYLHSSIGMFHPEIRQLISVNKNPDIYANMCEIYDCAELFEYRIRKGEEYCVRAERPYLTICGATTPGDLPEVIPQKSFETGLGRRFIFSYSDSRAELPEGLIPMEGTEEAENAVTKLRDILVGFGNRIRHEVIGKFRLAGGDGGPIHIALDEHYRQITKNRSASRQASWYDASDLHLIKLCMLNAAARNSIVIEEADFARARQDLTMYTGCLQKATQSLYNKRNESSLANVYRILTAYAGKHNKGEALSKRAVVGELSEAIPTNQIGYTLKMLEEGGFIRMEESVIHLRKRGE